MRKSSSLILALVSGVMLAAPAPNSLTVADAIELFASRATASIYKQRDSACRLTSFAIRGNRAIWHLEGDWSPCAQASGEWTCDLAQKPRLGTGWFSSRVDLDLKCDSTFSIWSGPGERESPEHMAAAWPLLSGFNAEPTQVETAVFEAATNAQRAAPDVGVLDDRARGFKLLAEAAVREGKLWPAAAQFERALALAPAWPQGNYNIALIYGELGACGRAMRYMRRYLTLVPDAANSQAARDKLSMWAARAEQGSC